MKKAGYSATVYEASDRLGGRCWSDRGSWAGGQVCEHGGERIDQNHDQIRNLVQELGLDLVNLLSAEPNGSEDRYFFDGSVYPYDQGYRNGAVESGQRAGAEIIAALGN
ncbi:FAD-dependent oxidoreductase [Dactylosporangium sp. CA-139114]|uniref:FAD-dependent oxidoreductase n=1 Tax=Dactylosporangium sp. CA-139114 TaxID=3239931 RepID=UPI003D97A92D